MDLALASCAAARFPEPINQLLQLERFAAANPAFYQNYPALFREAFPAVPDATVARLSAAGFLYYRSIIMLDGIMDGESADCPAQLRPLLPIAVGCCQEESIKLLCTCFPAGGEFWVTWNQRRAEYLRAYQLERQLMATGTFDEAVYLKIADYKAAFGKIAIDVLYLADGGRNGVTTAALLKAHREFSIGLQFIDDFQDFNIDHHSGQINYAQYLLDEHYAQPESTPSADPVRRKKDFYLSGIANRILARAEGHLQAAMAIVDTLSQPVRFRYTIQDSIDTTRRIRGQIAGYLKIVAEKVRLHGLIHPHPLPLPQPLEQLPRVAPAARAAYIFCLGEVIGEANRCFPEIKHLMYLSRAEGFDNGQEVHVGDTFQRALLLDCLLDYVGTQPHPLIATLIDQELDYILRLRAAEGVPGWSYFPTVREIAPDTDDLGQILQCLARGDRSAELQHLGAPLVDFVSEHLFDEATGGFTTWLVPRTGMTPLQRRQAQFNREKWGCGPDPEVVANILYGVAVAGLALPTFMVQRAANYLWGAREAGGFWNSRWYVGPYYGTYVGIRYFVRYTERPWEDYVSTIDYLLGAQAGDGSFAGNALSTSLALLTLAELMPYHQEIPSAINRGRRYLIDLCTERPEAIGAHPFIIPRVGQPFGSRTLTIGYILKALSQTEIR